MPVHQGHVALIRFAAPHCDELIVSMSYTTSDPIDHNLRFLWLKEIFKDDLKIKPVLVEDTFANESLPWPERTKLWALLIRKIFPPIDIVFSSEDYGEPFAKNLGAGHMIFDHQRKSFSVSASKILQQPFRYWNYIPDPVRPYFVKKICFYGPESTGKSSMTVHMANLYQTNYVPEVARELLVTNHFSVNDIITIGRAHYERIEKNVRFANKFLMCDTDAITTQIYSQYYLGAVPPILFELEAKVKYAHYFLFDTDVPWVDDGLRNLGHLRHEMFAIFRNALDQRKINYTLVSGNWKEREQIVRNALDQLLQAL